MLLPGFSTVHELSSRGQRGLPRIARRCWPTRRSLDHKYDFYGGQPVNQIFAESSSHVDPSFEFAPFQDYVNIHIQDEIAAAIGGNGTIAEAFDRVQDAIVEYATDQGYTVK